jgi:hypothetical protein
LQILVLIPSVELLAGFTLGDSISLLDYPLELLLAAVDLCEVVVDQFPPIAASQRLSFASNFLRPGSSPSYPPSSNARTTRLAILFQKRSLAGLARLRAGT